MSQTAFMTTTLQEEKQLGALVAVYQTQTTRAGELTLWSIGALFLLLIAGIVALFIWLMVPELNNPFFTPFFFISTVGFPLLIIGLAVFAFWWQLRLHISLATPIRRKITVSLYEQGFVYHEGRALHIVPWQQLRSIERLALPRKKLPRRYYKLTLQDTTELTLPVVIAHLQELGTAIEDEIKKRLLPMILADYEAQKPVPFSGICLNHNSVSKSDERLLWHQVEQVSLAHEKVTIKERGNTKAWLAIPAVQIRNICVLEALLIHIRENQGITLVIENGNETHASVTKEENASQLGQESDILRQDLTLEGNPGHLLALSRNELGKRPFPTGPQILSLVGIVCVILFALFFSLFNNLPSFGRNTATPTADAQATQASLANETSTVSAGKATAVVLETVVSQMSPRAIYQTYTQGKPLFRDPLTSFDNTYFYDYNPGTLKPSPGCVFQKDGLHITSSDTGYWIPCNNSAFPDLMNFTFQYDFALLKGDSAGLRFRALGSQSYYFAIDTSGNYQFIYYPDVTNGQSSQTIQAGKSPLMRKGYGVTNQLTLIAIGKLFYLYLNQQFIMKATDPTLTIGGLSLLVNSETAPTEAVFSQAVAWNIAGMAP